MPQITLSQGTIDYADEGEGPVAVFVHGFLVDGDLWKDTALALHDRARCIRPTLPLGAHRRAMGPGFDASPRAVARLVLELLDALELEDVTLVGNDTGGAICQFVLDERPERIARVVLTNCDCFDQFPPAPFNALRWLPRIPGAVAATALSARLGIVRRVGFAPIAKRLSRAQVDAWWKPFREDAQVRAETARLLENIKPAELADIALRLPRYEGRVLVVWAIEDRVFKPAMGRRLAALFADSEFVEVSDSRTFVPIDQPALLADLIAGELPLPTRGADRAAASPTAG